MQFEAKNFDSLFGTPGFSEQLLKNHFTLYQGYVTNTNKLSDRLAELAADGKIATAEFSELKRRFGWEFNGMRLHELYFGGMKNGGVALETSSHLAELITEQFGSFDAWLAEFKGVGAMRGIGWAVLAYDVLSKRLFNVWINEHDAGHLAGAVPVVIMDVFEHAFVLDYGIKRADYIAAFIQAIDWSVASAQIG